MIQLVDAAGNASDTNFRNTTEERREAFVCGLYSRSTRTRAITDVCFRWWLRQAIETAGIHRSTTQARSETLVSELHGWSNVTGVRPLPISMASQGVCQHAANVCSEAEMQRLQTVRILPEVCGRHALQQMRQ